MNARTYQVVFDWVQPGVSATDARNRLAAVYKVSPERIDALLSRNDHVLRKGLPFNVADRHKKAIESAGIICRLIPEELPNPNIEGLDPAMRAADDGLIVPHDGLSQATPLAVERRAPSPADPTHGAYVKGQGRISFEFTGQAGEYFRIWIVNACLSFISLGIYSAWAKVRRRRYFYGNTLLQDSGFERAERLSDHLGVIRPRP